MSEQQKGKSYVEFQRINTKDLIPHPIAQRNFMQQHANRIAKEFKWDKYDPILVSFRDGKYWVIDGQHRLAAIKQINNGKDVVIICRVYYGLTELEEAEMFLRKGVLNKKLSKNDIFKVLYKTGDTTIIGMVRGAERAGWCVDFKEKTQNGRIKAVEALRVCYNALSFEQYVEMLTILKKAWDGSKDSVIAQMLKGMAVFVRTFDGQYIYTDLIEHLSKVPVQNIIRDGKAYTTAAVSNYGGINGGIPCAKAIRDQYNKGKRSKRLPDVL